MPETDIASAVASDLTNAIKDYLVAPQSTDGPNEQGETRYTNRRWNQQLGFYKAIPELRAVIDARKKWTIGKGFKGVGDGAEMTEISLSIIKGIGKESFNTIMGNLCITADIGGDSFAEIMRDDFGGMINLKVLNPSKIVTISDKQGMILGYKQLNKGKKTPIPVERMFHIMRNRVADEGHGVSLIDSLIEIILMRNEAMTDWKRVLHRNIDPLWIFHMDTDDVGEIAAFKTKMDGARGKGGENMYIPKGVIVPEVVGVSSNAILNAMTWIDNLNEYFYEVAGVPKIIIGSSRAFTEASAKIAYLAFQQTIEEKQLYLEEQILDQLGVEINFEFPASLENELLSDQKKDVEEGATQPNDTTAGEGE